MRRLAVAAMALAACGLAYAAGDAAQALASARAAYPATDVRAARATPLPGIFEFDMGGETVYGDATARYLILGRLLDMRAEGVFPQRITPAQYAAAQDAAIVLQEGEGREVVVFSDPLCPYCAQLERRLLAGELAGYTVRLILVAFLPGSEQAVAGVLCSPDPASAYREAVLAGAQHPADCRPPAAAVHQRLAAQLGVQATPSLLGPAGYLHAGLLPPGELAAWAGRQQDAS